MHPTWELSFARCFAEQPTENVITHHGGTSLRGVAVMTMNENDDIEPDAGRDPDRMSADERRAELACILARGRRAPSSSIARTGLFQERSRRSLRPHALISRPT